MSGSADRMPQLEIKPAVGLVEDPIHAVAHNLSPGARVKLVATLKDERDSLFRCECYYVADVHGTVDTAAQPSVAGDFEGVQPNGLIEFLSSVPAGRRLVKRDLSRPWHITVKLGEGPCAISGSVDRWHMGPGVTMNKVSVGRLRGFIFEPRAELGRVPAVVDLFGMAWGVKAFRSAVCAAATHPMTALTALTPRSTPDLRMLCSWHRCSRSAASSPLRSATLATRTCRRSRTISRLAATSRTSRRRLCICRSTLAHLKALAWAWWAPALAAAWRWRWRRTFLAA